MVCLLDDFGIFHEIMPPIMPPPMHRINVVMRFPVSALISRYMPNVIRRSSRKYIIPKLIPHINLLVCAIFPMISPPTSVVNT